MLTVNLKIELSNLNKAMTEIKALENMVLDLAKTYETKFDTPTEVVEPKKVPAKKAPAKPKTVKPVEKVSEPVKEEKTEPSKVTLADLTAEAKRCVADGKRDEAKENISKYGVKLSAVDASNYEDLMIALKAL